MSTGRPDDTHSPTIFFRIAAAQFPTGAPPMARWWAARALLDDHLHETQSATGAATAMLDAVGDTDAPDRGRARCGPVSAHQGNRPVRTGAHHAHRAVTVTCEQHHATHPRRHELAELGEAGTVRTRERTPGKPPCAHRRAPRAQGRDRHLRAAPATKALRYWHRRRLVRG